MVPKNDLVPKSDLNLVPEEQKEGKSNLASTIALYVIAFAVVISVVGIFLPSRYLQSKIEEKNRLLEEEKELAAKAAEYDMLAEKNAYLSGRQKAFKSLDDGNLKVTDLLAELEKALPQSVVISRLMVSQTEIGFQAEVPSNTDIAQLYISLQKCQYFKSINISTITTDKGKNKLSLPINVSLTLGDDNMEKEEGGKE